MKIVNYSPNIQESPVLKILLSELESLFFADECRYEVVNFGRFFNCIFIKDGHYSKKVSMNINKINISDITSELSFLENKAQEIDVHWDE